MINILPALSITALSLAASSTAFVQNHHAISRMKSSTQLHLFEGLGLDKAFEDAGPLGKGITVGKIQVALTVGGNERQNKDSIFATLEKQARNNDDIGSSYDDDYDEGYGDSHLSKVSSRQLNIFVVCCCILSA